MAYSLLLTYLALFSLLSNFCHSFNPKLLNESKYGDGSNSGWLSTRATFYGDRNGPGPKMGQPNACGIDGIAGAPFYSKTTALATNSLFKGGKNCGTCFQLKCTSTTSPHCSGSPVTVVAIDSSDIYDHIFDLSGVSFGAMAISGQEGQLQGLGIVDIQYQSVACNFLGAFVAFHVQTGVGPYYFATSVQYENGDAITGVEIKPSQGNWKPMTLLWGIVYKTNFAPSDKGPYSIRLTDQSSRTIVAVNVIPANYGSGGVTYTSNVNF